MFVHIIWDIFHPETTFKVSNLNNKISELYSSATVASSVLLGSIMWNGFRLHPLFASDAIYVPLVLSTVVGMLVGFSGLFPKIQS